ncbi:hypothetical protein F4X10_24000 [Candidatus Poribacteria bacterium]|nr:hypothetical protein [Candidatus Poribacteria bacterium]
MKTLIFFLIFFSVLALPALAELTDADLDKIRLIVSESVNVSEKRIKQDIKAEIESTEKNIKQYIDLKIESVEKQLSTYNWVIYIFMPLIVAAIGVPTAIMAGRSVKDRSLERQVEALAQEIETLKQRQIVGP